MLDSIINCNLPFFNRMCEVICERNKNPFKRSDWIFKFTSDYRKQTKALAILHDFTDKMIQERKRLLTKNNETMSSYTSEETNVYGIVYYPIIYNFYRVWRLELAFIINIIHIS